tara:strand:- start:6676 stop:7677 length:1002 start_codon:yes stop_codon:yes gene_type:complete
MNDNMKVNFGQIGVGYWGPNLLRNLMSNQNSNVRKVVDLSLDRCNYVKNTFPTIDVSSNLDDVINDIEIDAIIISTPVSTHYDLAIKCLEAGKHILVEKPMAQTLDEVLKIEKIAKEKKLIAMVGHTFLYNPAVKYVKKLIDSNALGEIRYIYSQRLNLGRIRSDVDALWNFAPHDISIIQYWLDNPVPINVSKFGNSYIQEDINDVVFMNITYPNNIIANIHVSWLDPQKVRKMTVVGSKKMIVYDDISENKITIFDKSIDRMAILGENMDFDKNVMPIFNHKSGDVLCPKINWEEPLKKEIEAFVDSILNGTPCITDANHAAKVVKILSYD